MSHPFDATLKQIIAQHPGDFVGVFDLPRAPATLLNVDLSTLSAATDVAFGFGQPIKEIVDLNFQSGPDPRLAARLHLYNAAFHLRFGVPVRSVAILLRAKADTTGITGGLEYVSGGKRIQFEYDVVRLWEQPVQPFLQGGLGLLPLTPLCQLPEGEVSINALRRVILAIDERLSKEAPHDEAVRLMTGAFVLAGMRVAKEELGPIFEGVRVMHESTAYDYFLEEGQRKGQVRTLLRQGRKRFGAPSADVEAALARIEDADRLDRLADAIFTATSWNDLLQTA